MVQNVLSFQTNASMERLSVVTVIFLRRSFISRCWHGKTHPRLSSYFYRESSCILSFTPARRS